MYDLVPVVAEIMKDFYPDVQAKEEFIAKVIKNEEERFHETLNEGLAILSEVIKKERDKGSSQISGEDVFKLYDTYGFPVELTEEYAEDENMTVDREGFQAEMEKQRERARNARQDVGSMQVQGGALGDIKVESTFVGYENLTADSRIIELLQNGEIVSEAHEGDTVQILLDETPFYAESGGQVADKGTLKSAEAIIEIKDVKKAPNGQHVHEGVVVSGTAKKGLEVTAEVESALRKGIVKNHTATHLLHQALKDVLGSHVNQAGSLVNENRLRFDFSHFGQVTKEELSQIEKIVNEKIWEGISVAIDLKPIAEAKEMGAMALFGEKYGDIVRVVQVGDYSIELCGGCHVQNTAEIGLFKIASESGIGAGTRRIEAVTGKGAYEELNDQLAILEQAASELKSNTKDVPKRIASLQADLKEVQRENESLLAKLSQAEAGSILEKVTEVGGVKVLTEKVNAKDMNHLRTMVDDLKAKLGSAVIVLGAVQNGKVNISAGVTKDVIEKGLHAGKLVKQAAEICGGGGGGRPDMAQAGGKQPEKLEEALATVEESVKSVL